MQQYKNSKKGSVIENVRIKLENLTEKFNLQDETIKTIKKDMERPYAGMIAELSWLFLIFNITVIQCLEVKPY